MMISWRNILNDIGEVDCDKMDNKYSCLWSR